MVRSVVHQRGYAPSGFTALLPSAHCQGWAADVELAWFERFGAREALREVLLEYADSGVLNVIDEGRAWHVCLAPHAVAALQHVRPARRHACPVRRRRLMCGIALLDRPGRGSGG